MACLAPPMGSDLWAQLVYGTRIALAIGPFAAFMQVHRKRLWAHSSYWAVLSMSAHGDS